MLKTFAMGGVHPPENKLSTKSNITELPVPKAVIIPLGQHLGVPAKPLVNKGDDVKVGQLIAASEGFVSANIHSSVSGKVLKIDKALDSSGYTRDAIFINVEGDEWEDSIDRSPEIKKEISLSGAEITKKLAEAGIVGLGGATFPSHVKASVPKGKKAEYLIINGVECEPYLTADHMIMLEKPEELLVGIEIIKKALGVSAAIIGIENNKPDAIEKLSDIAGSYSGTTIQALKVQYPQGGEKQLIQAILKREVPSGGLPIDIGAVVFNVGTVYAIYEAIQKNKPLFERVVTVTGKSISKPSNFKVRLGTQVSELIEAAGGLPEDTGKIINGGPMMGKSLASTEIPVVKGSSGILIIKDEESKRKEIKPCIRCSKCVSVCPMGLEPFLLGVLGEKSMFARLEEEKVMDCIECGSCSFTCPSGRPLLDFIRFGKSNVGRIIRSRKQS
ncbi:MAG: electron transport complex subunit RsxC [Bacteroidales bacterium]|nr:electron transport complex subunit RsxC [Bacteroidales bacterium]MBN2821505.1 electron transport complex subunit RsxC [Bacteroidales bacterium]